MLHHETTSAGLLNDDIITGLAKRFVHDGWGVTSTASNWSTGLSPSSQLGLTISAPGTRVHSMQQTWGFKLELASLWGYHPLIAIPVPLRAIPHCDFNFGT